ncbi:MAG TPA: cytochrome c [Pyrinomonadaceae bacterium]|nr:cytochrome c [Pyrinomonadaceae bacterium]
MKLIKLALTCAALTVFVISCTTETTNTNQVSNSNTRTQTTNSPASTPQASPTPADEFAQTRVVYAEMCTVCHGPKGDGGTVKIQGKQLKVPSLKEGHALNHNEAQLAKQISEGGDGMPAFKDRLKPEVINDLVRLIRKEFQGIAATGTSPSPAKP